MPQLIAMIIVVVGAMIYMFQTFGGTGDKIEGIAQKTSVVTEINNIRTGLLLALTGQAIETTTVLSDLATLRYFANQINDELINNAGTAIAPVAADTDINGDENTYSAISFGGENNPGLFISLVVGNANTRPGIRVQFAGALANNAAFLETQLANDLSAVASIDRTTLDGAAVAIDANGDTPAGTRPADNALTVGTVAAGTAELSDGVFTVYYKDMPSTIR